MIRLPSGHLLVDPGVEVDVTVALVRNGLRQAQADEIMVTAAAEKVARAWVEAGNRNPAESGRPGAAEPAPSGLMTVTEAADRVGRSERTVRSWAASGRLPSAQLRGRLWLVDPIEVQEVAGG